MKKREQVGDTVIIRYDKRDIYFKMPSGFDLSTVDDSAKSLVEYLLFSSFEEIELAYSSPRGANIGLAYSGGTDSTAAYAILRETGKLFNFYHKRVDCGRSLMKQDNPLLAIKKNNMDCTIVESNQEIIRTDYGHMVGFSCDWSPLCAAILMANKEGIGYLSTGTMLESAYLQKGQIYRDFHNSHYRKKWTKIFEKCGFKLFIPTMGCSEYITGKICEIEGLFSSPCIRGEGVPCMNCYKCFRKEAMKNNLIPTPKEANIFMSKRPVKQAASLIHVMNKYGLDIPELREYKGMNTERIESYYKEALQTIPNEWQEYTIRQITKFCEIKENEDMKHFDIFTSVG